MDSVAIIEYGPVRVYAWTLLVYAGALAGVALSLWAGAKKGISPSRIAEAWLFSLPAGLIAGRLDRVLANWQGYSAQPGLIAQMGRPVTYPGLLAGGAIGLAVYAWWRRASWRAMADAMALGIPVAQAFIWAGAMLQGVAHGPVAYSGWAWELPDAFGVVLPRTPVQVLGVAAALLILAVLSWWPWRSAASTGQTFAVFLLLDGLAHLTLGFMRDDATAMVGPLRIAQVWHMVGTIVAMGLLLAWRGPRRGLRQDDRVDTEAARA